MLKKLLIKLGLLEDPKKTIEKLVSEFAVNSDEYVKVLPKKKPAKKSAKKAPAKKKAAKKAK